MQNGIDIKKLAARIKKPDLTIFAQIEPVQCDDGQTVSALVVLTNYWVALFYEDNCESLRDLAHELGISPRVSDGCIVRMARSKTWDTSAMPNWRAALKDSETFALLDDTMIRVAYHDAKLPLVRVYTVVQDDSPAAIIGLNDAIIEIFGDDGLCVPFSESDRRTLMPDAVRVIRRGRLYGAIASALLDDITTNRLLHGLLPTSATPEKGDAQ